MGPEAAPEPPARQETEGLALVRIAVHEGLGTHDGSQAFSQAFLATFIAAPPSTAPADAHTFGTRASDARTAASNATARNDRLPYTAGSSVPQTRPHASVPSASSRAVPTAGIYKATPRNEHP